ncbi:MAG TPA: F0F1 ATP synthase subunit A [Gemmatimonadaceae bacterium]|nr:F0F1 ATP synthase subunit A [Gemmatimonadaceae bacterium]
MRFVRSLLCTLALVAAPLAATGVAAQQHVDADSMAAAVGAQESQGVQPEAHAEAPAGAKGADKPDYITPHITDSRELEFPCLKPGFACHVELPRWEPIRIGNVAIDLSPTKHVVFLGLAALLSTVVLVGAAAAHKRHSHETGHPKGFAAGIEAMVLYLRNEVILPNVGHHGDKFVPFVLTLFFFILFANLLGLIPYGSTATGNISVTATLAIITFFVIEGAGMRAQGLGYLNTIVYWNKDLPLYMRIPMALIMTPVEIIGKFTKPFALAIRLFANMTAGHIVLLALIGLFFGFVASGGVGAIVGAAPLAMSVAIMMLELFVAFLQAFIFSLLASVFIGQIREAHH